MRLKIWIYGRHIYIAAMRQALEAQEALEQHCLDWMGKVCTDRATERKRGKERQRLLDARGYRYNRLSPDARSAFDCYRRAARGGPERAAVIAVLTDY